MRRRQRVAERWMRKGRLFSGVRVLVNTRERDELFVFYIISLYTERHKRLLSSLSLLWPARVHTDPDGHRFFPGNYLTVAPPPPPMLFSLFKVITRTRMWTSEPRITITSTPHLAAIYLSLYSVATRPVDQKF